MQQNKGQIVAVRYSHKDYKATLRYFFNHSGNDINIISKNNNKQRVNNFYSDDKNSIINNDNDDITVDIHEDTYQVDGIGGTTWDGSLITSKFMEELLLINFSTLLSGLNNIDIDNINSDHANKFSRSSSISRSISSRTLNSDNNNNHDALKYHIVELGCGSGITSIISSMLGCKVTATDRYCDLIVDNIYRVKHKYQIQQNQDRLLHNYNNKNNDNSSCSKHNVDDDDDVYIGDYGHDVDGQNYDDKFLDIHAMTLTWESSSKQQQQQQQADSKQNDINKSRNNHKHKDSIHDDYISCSRCSRCSSSSSSSSSSLHNYNTPQSILYNRGDIDIIIGAEITCLIKQQHLLVDIIDELTSPTSITTHEINYNNIHSMGDITDINNRDSDSVRKSSKNDNHTHQYSHHHHHHTNIKHKNNNPKIIFLSFDGLPDINIHTTKYEINMIELMKKKKYLYSVVYVGHIEWISNDDDDDDDDDDYKEELMHNTDRLRMGSSFPIPPPPPNHTKDSNTYHRNRPPPPLYKNIDHNNDKNLHQNINKTSKAVFHNYTDFYSNRKNDFNFLNLFPKSQKHSGTKSLKAIKKSKDHNNIHSNISIEKVNGYNNEEDNALRLSDNNSHHIIAFYHISSLNTCSRCHKQYLNIKGFNHKISCKYHSGFYICRNRSSKLNSTMNHNNLGGDGLDYDSNNTIANTNCDVNVTFWDCCGNEDRDCVGCCMSYHEGYK